MVRKTWTLQAADMYVCTGHGEQLKVEINVPDTEIIFLPPSTESHVGTNGGDPGSHYKNMVQL